MKKKKKLEIPKTKCSKYIPLVQCQSLFERSSARNLIFKDVHPSSD